MSNVGILEVNFKDHPTLIYNSLLIESFYNDDHIQYMCMYSKCNLTINTIKEELCHRNTSMKWMHVM